MALMNRLLSWRRIKAPPDEPGIQLGLSQLDSARRSLSDNPYNNARDNWDGHSATQLPGAVSAPAALPPLASPATQGSTGTAAENRAHEAYRILDLRTATAEPCASERGPPGAARDTACHAAPYGPGDPGVSDVSCGAMLHSDQDDTAAEGPPRREAATAEGAGTVWRPAATVYSPAADASSAPLACTVIPTAPVVDEPTNKAKSAHGEGAAAAAAAGSAGRCLAAEGEEPTTPDRVAELPPAVLDPLASDSSGCATPRSDGGAPAASGQALGSAAPPAVASDGPAAAAPCTSNAAPCERESDAPAALAHSADAAASPANMPSEDAAALQQPDALNEQPDLTGAGVSTEPAAQPVGREVQSLNSDSIGAIAEAGRCKGDRPPLPQPARADGSFLQPRGTAPAAAGGTVGDVRPTLRVRPGSAAAPAPAPVDVHSASALASVDSSATSPSVCRVLPAPLPPGSSGTATAVSAAGAAAVGDDAGGAAWLARGDVFLAVLRSRLAGSALLARRWRALATPCTAAATLQVRIVSCVCVPFFAADVALLAAERIAIVVFVLSRIPATLHPAHSWQAFWQLPGVQGVGALRRQLPAR